MQRLPPPRRRRAFTLLELLVVLVLLGLTAAFVLPTLRLPAPATGQGSALSRARATAVRRGEAVRLEFGASGSWTVRATADTTGVILLAGRATSADSQAGVAQSVVISALGACLPEGTAVGGTVAWDPARCAAARH
ncbi:MAG: GspH/FimT family pseudopilin [Gemmatimonadaceae bacterium]|nr:GspH/FimT family pseudopilin [Gemmatimonadaceae bacterium]